MEHWLLYTSDREHGGTLILGIFSSYNDAWDYYYRTHDMNDRYWRRPSVSQWINENKIEDI